jgi:hypothetical protein
MDRAMPSAFSAALPGAEVDIDLGLEGPRLIVWLQPDWAATYLDGGFWLELVAAKPADGAWYVRFQHAFDAFNRSAFALSEWLPASDPEQRPEGAWLLPSAHRRPALGASI